jgi:hypothetical protein
MACKVCARGCEDFAGGKAPGAHLVIVNLVEGAHRKILPSMHGMISN